MCLHSLQRHCLVLDSNAVKVPNVKRSRRSEFSSGNELYTHNFGAKTSDMMSHLYQYKMVVDPRL